MLATCWCCEICLQLGVEQENRVIQKGEKVPTAIDLHRELNKHKKTELSWMYQVSKCAPQEALRHVDKAYDNFFRKVKLEKQGNYKGNVGFPKFKKKSRGIGSFRLTGVIDAGS
jgi:putative transposase